MKYLLLCFSLFVCFTANADVVGYKKEIDYDRELAKELKKSEIDYKRLQNYIDNSENGISDEQIDDLYLRVFRGVCVSKDRKEEEFNSIAKIVPWQYVYSERLFYDIASIAAFRDEEPNIGMCILSMVSNYKIADLKFLDVSLKVADEYKAKNFENTIIQVREEIDKLKQ